MVTLMKIAIVVNPCLWSYLNFILTSLITAGYLGTLKGRSYKGPQLPYWGYIIKFIPTNPSNQTPQTILFRVGGVSLVLPCGIESGYFSLFVGGSLLF